MAFLDDSNKGNVMGFLDNSGDIILDAVLTDEGRRRLALGDGSFRITKFAVGDDEIDYSLYNKNHPSGSAFYDLEVLRTPVLEAFTNNTSGMRSKLMSISRTNILHLPVMKLHDGGLDGVAGGNSDLTKLSGDLSSFLITVDANTEDTTDSFIDNNIRGKGLIKGSTTANIADPTSAVIAVELGLDTLQLSPSSVYKRQVCIHQTYKKHNLFLSLIQDLVALLIKTATLLTFPL